MQKKLFILLFILGFLSCKRSILQQSQWEYDPKLVRTLNKLERKFADRKIRINTWDKQADAYQDIQVLDDDQQTLQTLTIGDSVKFIKVDFSRPDGIRAEIRLNNNSTGFIPYNKIEEFYPAVQVDPDLN